MSQVFLLPDGILKQEFMSPFQNRGTLQPFRQPLMLSWSQRRCQRRRTRQKPEPRGGPVLIQRSERDWESLAVSLGGKWWTFALLAHTALTHLAGASSEAKSFNLPTLWHVGEKRDYGASNMRFQMLIQYHQNFGLSFLWMPSFKTQKERYPW